MGDLFKIYHAFWFCKPFQSASSFSIINENTLISISKNCFILWNYLEKSRQIKNFDTSDGHSLNNAVYDDKFTILKPLISASHGYLFCAGVQSYIRVLDAIDFTIIYTLCSKLNPDWISSFCLLHNASSNLDVIIGITITGYVKLWTLSNCEHDEQLKAGISSSKDIYENEAKQAGLLNCIDITFCIDNPKIFLLVSSDTFKLYNVANFSKLCERSSPHASILWKGGSFLDKYHFIVWTDNPFAYLFQFKPSSQTNCELEILAVFQIPSTQKQDDDSLAQYSYYDGFLLCFYNQQIFLWRNIKRYLCNNFLTKEDNKLITIDPDDTFEINHQGLPPNYEEHFTLPNNLHTIITSNDQSPPHAELSITTSIFLPLHDYYLFGTSNGRIYVLQRASLNLLEYFDDYLGQFSRCQYLSHESSNNYLTNIPLLRDLSVTHLYYPHSMDESYESNHLISADIHSRIYLWDLNTFSLCHTFDPHTGAMPMRDIVLLPLSIKDSPHHNRLILSFSRDNTLAIMDINRNTTLVSLLSASYSFVNEVIRILWLPNKGFLIIVCDDRTLTVWQIENGVLDRQMYGVEADTFLHNLNAQTIWPTCYSELRCLSPMNDPQAFFNANSSPLITLYNGTRFYDPYETYSSNLSFQIAAYDLTFFAKMFHPEPRRSRSVSPKKHITFDIDHITSSPLPRKSSILSSLNDSSNPLFIPITDQEDNSIALQKKLIYKQASLKERTSVPGCHDLNQLYYNASSPIRKRSRMVYEKKILVLLLASLHPWDIDYELDGYLNKILGCEQSSNAYENVLISSSGDISFPQGQELRIDCCNSLIVKTRRLVQLLVILKILEKIYQNESDWKDDFPATTAVASKESGDQDGLNISKRFMKSLETCQQLKIFYLRYFLSENPPKFGGQHQASFKKDKLSGIALDLLFSNITKDDLVKLTCYTVLSYIFFSQDFLTDVVTAKELMRNPSPLNKNTRTMNKYHQNDLISYVLDVCIHKLEILYHFLRIFNNRLHKQQRTQTNNNNNNRGSSLSSSHVEFRYNPAAQSQKSNKRTSTSKKSKWSPQNHSLNDKKIDESGVKDYDAFEDLESVEEVVDDMYFNDSFSPNSKTEIPGDPENYDDAYSGYENDSEHKASVAPLLASAGTIHIQSFERYFGIPFENNYKFYGCFPDTIIAFVSMGFFGSKLPPDLNTFEIKNGSPYKRFSQYFSLKNPRLIILTSNLIMSFINGPLNYPRPDKKSNSSFDNFAIQNFDFPAYFSQCDILNKRLAYQVLCQGFSTWEPFLDVSALILRLLDLCRIAQFTEQSYKIPSDSSKSFYASTFTCLNDIALLRSAAFITIINKEINKNMMGNSVAPLQNMNISSNMMAPANATLMNTSIVHKISSPTPAASYQYVLPKSRDYVIAIIENLVTVKPNDIIDLLPEVIDIYLYYGSHTINKSKDWESFLVSYFKFPQVVFNSDKKLLILGTRRAQLYLYDFRTVKPDVFNTFHQTPITALSFSPDYKLLASYSNLENSLIIWQIASALFGIGSSQVKYLKSYKLERPPSSSLSSSPPIKNHKINLDGPKNAKIVWVNNRAILILFSDGSEQKIFI